MRLSLSIALITLCVVVTGACSGSRTTASASARAQTVPAAGTDPTYTPTATIKDVMDDIIDPAGDLVWDATSVVVDQKGTTETLPRSEEDWRTVKRGAMLIVEGANLLQMPGRHMARAGETSEVPGVELEPAEMEALVDKDRASWNEHARNLHAAGLEVLQAVEAKDSQKLFEVGGKLDSACESCHRAYWYPNEKVPDFPSGIISKGAGD